MSRSAYTDECDSQEAQWALIRWRGAVASAIRGRRGQAFLRELREALLALPKKRLIRDELQNPTSGEVCALGAVGLGRDLDMSDLDPDDYEELAVVFGIAEALVREIEYENDEYWTLSPEQRWSHVMSWVNRNLKD